MTSPPKTDAIEITVRSWVNLVVPYTALWLPVGDRWAKGRARRVRMARKRRRGWA